MIVSINRYLIIKYKTSCPNQSWNKELNAQKLTFYNIFRKKIPINKENISQNMFPISIIDLTVDILFADILAYYFDIKWNNC